MPRKRIIGECQICGKQGELSFEHVPNAAAFNKKIVIEYSWEDIVIHKKVKGRKMQGGIGEYTLCEKCNNDTGSWYADEYTKWAKTCLDFLSKRKPSSKNPDEAQLTLYNVYPLRFLKQVVVCFFSIAIGLAQSHPELVNFALNKNEKLISDDYRFYLNFYYGSAPVLRRWNMAGKLTVAYTGNNLIPLSGSVISEMTHPPFAIIMAHNTGFPEAGDITPFKYYDYDQQAKDVTLKLKVLKGQSIYPGSFE